MLRRVRRWGIVALLAIAAAVLLQSPIATAQQTPPGGAISLLAAGTVTGPAVAWPGGTGVFAAVGTFGGSTVTLQFLGPDGVTWVAVGTATTLTAAGVGTFSLPAGKVRGAISGGAGPSITASVYQVLTLLQ